MKARWLAFFSAVALVLFACATTPTYQPAKNSDSVGYTETAIEADRYRVTYRGGNPDTAYDYALLRASELTLAKGHEWFRVTYATTDEEGYDSSPSVAVGGSTGSWRGRSASGVGVGIGIPIGGGREAVQTFEFVMGSGPKPEDPDVYDAKSVSDSIRQRMSTT